MKGTPNSFIKKKKKREKEFKISKRVLTNLNGHLKSNIKLYYLRKKA